MKQSLDLSWNMGALKLTRWPALSSARHRKKNKEKAKNKPSSMVREDSLGGRSETTGVRFVKQVGSEREREGVIAFPIISLELIKLGTSNFVC